MFWQPWRENKTAGEKSQWTYRRKLLCQQYRGSKSGKIINLYIKIHCNCYVVETKNQSLPMVYGKISMSQAKWEYFETTFSNCLVVLHQTDNTFFPFVDGSHIYIDKILITWG